MSYKDIKQLLLDEASISGKESMSVKIVNEPIRKKKKIANILKSNTLNFTRKDSSVGQSPNSSSSNITTPNQVNDQTTCNVSSSVFSRPKTGSMGDKMDKASAIARKARRAAERLNSKGQKRSGEEIEDKQVSTMAGKGSQIRRRATTTSDMSNSKVSGRLTSGRRFQGTERAVQQNLSGTSSNSMPDKNVGSSGSSSSNEKMRLRTQTHSLASNEQSNSVSRAPLTPITASGLSSSNTIPTLSAKFGPISSSSPRPAESGCKDGPEQCLSNKKSKCGSITLPIYVFDYNCNALIDNLIKSSQNDRNSQKFLTLNSLFDKEVLDIEASDSITTIHPKSEKDAIKKCESGANANQTKDLLSFDDVIQKHCNQIQLLYYKSFSKMLFKSLQLDLPIHRFDIQHALDCCENENIMEIDITKFLLNVCGHANIQNVNHGDTSEKKKAALYSNKKITKHDITSNVSENQSESRIGATKYAPMNCDELFDSHHGGIKRKFDGLILNSFKLVNLSQDSNLYYYSPNNRCLDDELPEPPPGSISRKRRSTKDTIGGSSVCTNVTGDEDQSNEDISDFTKLPFSARIQHLMNDSSSDIGGSKTEERRVS